MEIKEQVKEKLIERGVGFGDLVEKCETIGDLQKLDAEYRRLTNGA